MNYKKIIVLTAALSMLIFSGCSSEKAAEGTDAPQTTISTEETTAAETEADTEAAPTDTEAAPAEALSAEEAYAAKNGASWTDSLMKSMQSHKDKGNVEIKCSFVEDEMETSVEMSLYGSKVYMDTNIAGLMRMTMIIDGDKAYLLDIASKSYCPDTENTYDADSEIDSIVDTEEDYSAFAEDGIENIDGTDYIFEKFASDDYESIFYYSPDGKLCKISEDDMITDFTIELQDKPDESRFEIPADYTEVDSEKMAELMMGDLFAAMEETSSEDDSE